MRRHFTFARLAVRLQSEANRTAAADSSHRVVTRAIAAAIVHGTRLCGETSTLSQTPTRNTQARMCLTLLISIHLKWHDTFSPKGNLEWKQLHQESQ